MRRLTKTEIKATILIFVVVLVVTMYNMGLALRRSRDAQRRADIGAISDALGRFYTDHGFFPPSDNGKIKICKGSNFEEVYSDMSDDPVFDRNKFFSGLRGCIWGEDAFEDILGGGQDYLSTIPADPRRNIGFEYLYLSDTAYFQLFSALEGGENEDTYNLGVVGRNLLCGKHVCSFGKSFSDIPLDISIEEFRKKLEELRRGSQN